MADLPSTTNRISLSDIDASAFQHPLDREATAQLKKIKGFDQVVGKFLEYGFERFDNIWNNSSSIQVGPRQLPRLHALLLECCHTLDISPVPELYVANGEVNAFTSGHNAPYIVLLSGLVDLMNDDEIMAVIAHELGHIKCGHVLYQTMANYLGLIAQLAGDLTFGIGVLLSMPIQAGLVNWYRRSELSADRAALLAVQEPRPCISMLMKLAGGSGRLAEQMNVEEFLIQARNYSEDADKNTSERIYRILANAFMKGTHPFAVERAKALNEWIDSAEYEKIVINLDYLRVPRRVQDGRCPRCNTPVGVGHRFCGVCGHPIQS